MVPFMPAEFYLFFGLQLPATILLGLLSGIVAVHLFVIRRGRFSLRALAGVVLIAALESAVIVQNPLAWSVLLMLWALMAGSMALGWIWPSSSGWTSSGPSPAFPSACVGRFCRSSLPACSP